MPDVFISYSRRDKTFVEKLVKALEEQKRDVWVDFEDIPFASEWWEEIQKGIESSEFAVFVLSPDYLASEVCGLEVNYVQRNNKRIVPIVFEKPERNTVPDTLAALNWIFFDDPNAFDDSITKLQTTLDTNLVEMRQHTRLLVKASDWAKSGHTDSLLLRGEELQELLKLRDRSDITELMRDFLLRSEERHRRDEMIWRFFWGLLGGLVGIAVWAFSTYRPGLELIPPDRVVYTIAVGQVFGACLGLLSVFADELPHRLQRWLGKSLALRFVLRSLLFMGIGLFAWASYLWFLARLGGDIQSENALLFGGFTLALGFLIRSVIKLPAWVFTLVMAALIWLPIYITYQDYVNFVPLIYFDIPNQVFTIGIPMAVIIAVGANARAIYEQVIVRYRQMRSKPTAITPVKA